VRVFNWGDREYSPDFTLGYGEDWTVDGGRLVFTPDRPIGVVEKCTFCVERIDQGEQPFCVEVCPTGARVFGDLNDPGSEVAQLVGEDGAVQLLSELGTDPHVFYLPVEHERNIS
jgi:molybdopterin-containing oxidoreductase family iron-sulfur binding subunit